MPCTAPPISSLCSRYIRRRYLWVCALFLTALFLPGAACALEILAAGDLTPACRLKHRPGLSLFSTAARERIGQASLFLWNCETSGVSQRFKPNQFIFAVEEALLQQLRFANGVAITSNNHAFDGYEEGARTLLDALQRQGVRQHGLFRPGNYVPLILYDPWHPPVFILAGSPMLSGAGSQLTGLNYPELLRRVRCLRSQNKHALIVAYVHDGKEGDAFPTIRQKTWARLLADAGTDVLLFAHSHRYGSFEILPDSPRHCFVAWGLGNFIFGGHSAWQQHRDVRLLSISIDTRTGYKEGHWIMGHTVNWQFCLKEGEV